MSTKGNLVTSTEINNESFCFPSCLYAWVNSKHYRHHPPGEGHKHLIFLKIILLIPCYRAKTDGQIPHPRDVKRWQIPHAREHMSLIEFNKPVYTNQSLLKYIKKYIKLPSKMSTSFVRLFSTNQTFTNSSFSPLTHNSVYIECKVANGNHKDTFTPIILCQIPRGFRVLV